MKISAFTFNPFGEMTYLLWDPDSLEAAVVDPGMISEEETKKLEDFVKSRHLTVKYIINTHMHLDHVFGDNVARERFGADIWASEHDAFLGEDLPSQAAQFHLPLKAAPVRADHSLSQGDTLQLGKEHLEVLEVPGHSPGSLALYCPESHFVVVGDTLFQGSVGRTDLPGGNQCQLIDSIRNRLFHLPDDTLVVPGHGPVTTIGDERRSNPYV